MNNKLYDKILNSINREVKSAIKEQFSIDDLVFDNDAEENNVTIFDKVIIDPNDVFNRMVNGNTISKDEIELLHYLEPVFKVRTRRDLLVIATFYNMFYPAYSLNWLDVSEIEDMSYIFCNFGKYNGDISKWDVSNVKSMAAMFEYSDFNNDISGWDVSGVTNMKEMFYHSKFNYDISGWDVSNVTDMTQMFYNASFNHDISKWNISKYTKISYMFAYSSYDNDMRGSSICNNRYYNECIFYECKIRPEYIPKRKKR